MFSLLRFLFVSFTWPLIKLPCFMSHYSILGPTDHSLCRKNKSKTIVNKEWREAAQRLCKCGHEEGSHTEPCLDWTLLLWGLKKPILIAWKKVFPRKKVLGESMKFGGYVSWGHLVTALGTNTSPGWFLLILSSFSLGGATAELKRELVDRVYTQGQMWATRFCLLGSRMG